jgi:hypothetical protein
VVGSAPGSPSDTSDRRCAGRSRSISHLLVTAYPEDGGGEGVCQYPTATNYPGKDVGSARTPCFLASYLLSILIL